MNNLSKNILNYFATYTETRFNFRKLINYRWTNDELSLDLSLFAVFQEKIFEKIKSGNFREIRVKKNQYTITISFQEITSAIQKQLSETYHLKYLKSCINQAKKKEYKADKKMIASDKGEVGVESDSEDNKRSITNKSFLDGTRAFNLSIRKMLEEVLINLQEEKLSKIKEDLMVEHVPPTVFNPHNYIQQHFNYLKDLAKKTKNETTYFKKTKEYFQKNIKDIIIYDLFFNLHKYSAYLGLGTQYLFLQELNRSTEDKEQLSFPIFFIEIEIKATPSEIIITTPRKLILINSPAINYFQFPSVLTTPRASSMDNINQHISQVEIFLQTHYGYKDPFILKTIFKPIIPPKDSFPEIRSRFGIQIIKNEDKKLLDYSEILTRLQLGDKSNFEDFVSDYIEGNVENNQTEVDENFHTNYPIKSPKRYISDNPLPLNDSQKRIILALENKKNRIIVVDGPPGTGKSHTIAAISYWANQNNRSVVITSHKKAALDVIDDMLTSKFQKLHPKIKPSIIRFDPNGQTLNTLTNTLQSSVLNAAGDRSIGFNKKAIEEDEKNITQELERQVNERFRISESIEDDSKKILDFELAGKSLVEDNILSEKDIQLPKLGNDVIIDFDLIEEKVKDKTDSVPNITLKQYGFLQESLQKLSTFLDACEKLHQLSKEALDFEVKINEIPQEFIKLINSSIEIFNNQIPVHSLNSQHLKGGFIKKIFGKIPNKEKATNIIKSFQSLKYAKILKETSNLQNTEQKNLTLEDIKQGINDLQILIPLKQQKDFVKKFNTLNKDNDFSVQEIYDVVSQFQNLEDYLTTELYSSLVSLDSHYGSLLKKADISSNHLNILNKLHNLSDKEKDLWNWIKAHYQLSHKATFTEFNKDTLDNFYAIKQKEIEHLNDQRLKNLNNFVGDIARIKESFQGGKRFSEEQTMVLLENVPVIIAEPSMISKYFPMSEDSIDILVIDEASQVSIADSTSLILRAKQVVVFGDEYQYGAVGAVNVSSKYASSYFKEIMDAYSEDYKTQISPQQQKELIEELSKEITQEEDQEVEEVITPKEMEGKILWLKTFNIRTSTLSFAKAIANYSTSLRVHFRSFPEIIDYSNEYFYKPAQMELTVNRIRTKPIGEVLKFIEIETKGQSGPNINLDEIEAIIKDLKERLDNGFKGSIGIITSFREQEAKLMQILGEEFNLSELKKKHSFEVWFVGDVQGIERDLVYYTFVEDNKFPDTSLTNIYPVIGGTADNIRSLKMQRLNVGFSRAKDTMLFVHSMPIKKYANTRLGDSLKHYNKLLDSNLKNDYFIEDESILESEAEKKLYSLLLQTDFVKVYRDNIKIIPQFKIGDYIKAEFKKQIPKYRVDFLVTFSKGGKEQTLILEYDGVEYHTKNPDIVTKHNFTQEFLDYDVARQLELESYGYRFLRINKFTLKPESDKEQEKDVLNRFLQESFTIEE